MMQNPSAFIHSHNVNYTLRQGEGMVEDVTPPTWETGSVYHFTPLAQCVVVSSVILSIFD